MEFGISSPPPRKKTAAASHSLEINAMAFRVVARRRALFCPHVQCTLPTTSLNHMGSDSDSPIYPKTKRRAASTVITSPPRGMMLMSSLTRNLDPKVNNEATTDATSDFVDNSMKEEVDPGFVPERVMEKLDKAAMWNLGLERKVDWDPVFCRRAVDDYERHLTHILRRLEEHGERHADVALEEIVPRHLVQATQHLLSAQTAKRAMMAVLKCKLHTTVLSKRVRELERLIGSIGRTPLTEALSLRLVEANGKAGNIGRVLSLLNLRKSRKYKAVEREFLYAVQAIESAGLYMREGRNILLGDSHQPDIDNPTRWLDAILIHMHNRGIPLTTKMANRMLNCYASTGKTSKALHFFYFVTRQPVVDPETLENVPLTDDDYRDMPIFRDRRVRVKMRFRPPPNYYKVPSESQDKLVSMPGETTRKTKLEFETDPNWSLPLTAAFSFADSLTHGACGHAPIVLDVTSWNTLIKICCYRGALWRAMQILDETMPQQGIEPNTISYNTILAGLARVGDTVTQKELFIMMNNKGIPISKQTVEAMVDGMLNKGDIAGAITFVQDVFNQHSKLPPYTTHLKIIEFALASDLPYEAKRHVYLLQQLWRWEPNEYHDPTTILEIELTRNNPKLSKVSIRKLFAFFGENLDDSDFF